MKKLFIILFVALFGLLLAGRATTKEINDPPPAHPIDGLTTTLDHFTGVIPAGQYTPIPAPTNPFPNVPSWSKLVFQSLRNLNDWNIYLANGDGSNEIGLTGNSSEQEIHPRLNRGNTRIVFASDRDGDFEIFVVNTDGSGLAQLTHNEEDDVNPDWSADGTQIVFESYRDGQPEIYVMVGNGSNQTRLTFDEDYDGMPVWSPDGTKIAFSSRRSGGYRIYSMDPAGGNLTQLSSQPYSLFPTWSPDSNSIAYSSDTDNNGFLSLWRMQADGNGQLELFRPNGTIDIWTRSWSADGRYVGYTTINFIYYQGNWYWTSAYLDGLDTFVSGTIRMSGDDLAWYPGWQTTDTQAPTSVLNPLAALSSASISLVWSGMDSGPAGILNYDLQVKDGANGAWTTWQTLSGTTTQYLGIAGHTYYFRLRARDNAHNLEAWPANHESLTTIESYPPTTTVLPLEPYTYHETTISWGGNDPGGSGIASYDVQYRVGNGIWVDWKMATTDSKAMFTGPAGTSYSFRSRARDNAQNLEPWPAGNGDTTTTLYDWTLGGTISDSGGAPITLSSITGIPPLLGATSGPNGRYNAYGLTNIPNYDIEWLQAGYGNLDQSLFATNKFAPFTAQLPPLNNTVANWGFESGSLAPDWLVSGGSIPQITSLNPHTGQYGVQLNDHPAGFASPLQFEFANYNSYPYIQLFEGQANSLHALWNSGNGKLSYMWRNANDDWTSPQDSGISAFATLVLDSDKTPHLFWPEYQQNGFWAIQHSYQDSPGHWLPAQTSVNNIPSIENRTFIFDKGDQFHLIWETSNNDIYHCLYHIGTTCTAQTDLSANYLQNALIIDGTLHIFYGKYDLSHTQRDINGQWSTTLLVSDIYPMSIGKAISGVEGSIHLLWSKIIWSESDYFYSRYQQGQLVDQHEFTDDVGYFDDATSDSTGILYVTILNQVNGKVYLAERTVTGEWLEFVDLGVIWAHYTKIAVGGDGSINIMGFNGIEVFYFRRDPNGVWDEPINLTETLNQNTEIPALLLDSSNLVHIVHFMEYPPNDFYYHGPVLANGESDMVLSQANILVPAENPMLSLAYRLNGAMAGGDSQLQVVVDDGANPAVVWSSNGPAGNWTYQSIPLADWAGDTVTVTVKLVQAAGEPVVWATVDELSVGTVYPNVWLTGSGPAEGLPGDTITYTLEYGNLGSVVAEGSTISLTLPAGLTYLSASVPPISTFPLVWDVGNVPAGSGPFIIQVVALINPNATPFANITATANIAPAGTELETTNNAVQMITLISNRIYLPAIAR